MIKNYADIGSETLKYKGFTVDHEWDNDDFGNKVLGSDSYIVFDENENPISQWFKTWTEVKNFINRREDR